ncbi:MAG TPA: class I SAM-dependent methyltransferase [Sunxiuqinia sp.]|nr:class I SAM-dependent methyltransferase [Sunxiuqinia sp.]
MKRLQRFFEDKTINNVLDIGTGTGDFLKLLDDTFGNGAQLIGVDPGEQWLKKARIRFQDDHIEFRCMSGEKLEFDDDTFDVVSISKALHHLENRKQALAEMKRVVRPNGWIIINEVTDGDLNEAQENQKMLHHFKSFVDRLHGISHRQTFTQEEVVEIVEQNGIRIAYSYPHLKMKNPNFDELFLNEKYEEMKSLLEELQGRPEYDQKKNQLPLFRERLNKYGFQMANQLMVIGQVKKD